MFFALSVAREYVVAAGLSGLTPFTTDRVTGYSVDFRPTIDIGGVQHCFSDADTDSTVKR